MIRDAIADDARGVCGIYNPYVLETTITFEEQAVTEQAMRERILETTAALPWLVSEEQGDILGYSYATRWKARPAYRYSVETTVYVKNGAVGRGLGTQLYVELIKRLRGLGMHRAMGGIALPNNASVALHQKLGFKKVAHFPEVGYKMGRWIDVAYWQLEL